MLPEEMKVTSEDIAFAEGILLPDGEHFDEERVAFIKNLSTIDLQAVPGSGKTTALLAKLLIIERYLPLGDGSGVLVISHTNVAVDEIKNKIGNYCPKLFSYPNFVGTIQSFVDKFLAIPYGHNYLNTGFRWIDSDLYQDSLYKKFKTIEWSTKYDKPGSLFWRKYYNGCLSEAKNNKANASKLYEEKLKSAVSFLYLDVTDSKIKTFYDNTTILGDPKNKKYHALKTIIEELIDRGIISYEYAYHFAMAYCCRAPIIKKLLQMRFVYVFVDEMQDMELHQYDLLEGLFCCDTVVYQRIGDKNQAIFSGRVSLEEIWIDRDTMLTLKGSYRLSTQTASVVDNFALDPSLNIEGRMEQDIVPCLIVYSNDSIDKVLSTFTQLIKDKIPEKTMSAQKYPIKCIGWIGKEKEEGKITLKDYFSGYERKLLYVKVNHPNLLCHLTSWRMASKQRHILNSIRKSILDAFIRVLQMEQVTRENGREFHVRSLYNLFRDCHRDFYESFILKIHEWSWNVFKGKYNETAGEIRIFLPSLLALFDATVDKSKEFVESTDVHEEYNMAEAPEQSEANVFSCEDTELQVQVGTVHSAKGETHLATLYVETFYQGKYESENLSVCYCGDGHNLSSNKNRDKRKKESIKIAYVGMSRPNHLLCVAIHKDRYEPLKDKLSSWDIVSIP